MKIYFPVAFPQMVLNEEALTRKQYTLIVCNKMSTHIILTVKRSCKLKLWQLVNVIISSSFVYKITENYKRGSVDIRL